MSGFARRFVRGVCVEVRISKDELVVLSYPGPDRSVRLEDLRAGRALPRRYRNRRIGEFLKELDMTEGRSTGIPKILHAMEANGSPAAVFDFDEDHTYFICRLPAHPQATMPEGLTPEVTPKVPPKYPPSPPQVGPMSRPMRAMVGLMMVTGGSVQPPKSQVKSQVKSRVK